ncbi:MAG: leucyl/phenylalanyl-tRNA--protein transferase [Xanthobacteraceae bacterium]
MSAMTVWSEPVTAVRDPAEQKTVIFREAPLDRLQRIALGTAWALRPNRIGGLPALARLWLTDLVAPARDLPAPADALTRPDGLCGIAHDLSVPTLLQAYRRGLYPFCHFGPVKWWSPAERCLLFFENMHLSKRVRSIMRQGRYRVTFDERFDEVMQGCAAPRSGRLHLTWITPRIMRAYADLHDAGHAHSFEVWNRDGALVGGGYGVAVGKTFTIESRFAAESNTSKIGLAVLNWHLAHWGFVYNDNKTPNQNVTETGFRMVPRSAFLTLLADYGHAPDRTGCWDVETDVKTVAGWDPARGRL